MKVLVIFNHQPYDGSDIAWNGLRLCGQLLQAKAELRVFLMNDSVDLARDVCKPPDGYFDLGQMLKDLIAKGVTVKVCGTCNARCGRYRNEPYFSGAIEATMPELAEWVTQADRVITL